MCRQLALALLLLLAAPAVVGAQTVVGELVDGETGGPITRSFVFLMDTDGQRVGGTMTADDGRFRLRARRPGTYALRAERLGYETVDSELLTLSAGDVVRYRFVVAARPFVLDGIDVATDRRCVVRPEEGRHVARVWEEASKALRATEVTQQEEMYIFVARFFRTELGPRRLEMRSEDSWERVIVGAVPFESLDPDDMAEHGFVRRGADETFLYGPDARLLLSDPFLDTHCLRLSGASPDHPGLIGVEFEPVPGRDLPDIEGVVWMDGATGELRSVEYQYAGRLPFRAGRRHAGGRIDFERLESGAWIVRSWWIRVPHIREGRSSQSVQFFTVEGSEVLEVRDRDGRLLQTMASG